MNTLNCVFLGRQELQPSKIQTVLRQMEQRMFIIILRVSQVRIKSHV